MELDSTMGGESKGRGAWVPFTPTKSVSARYEINSTGKGLNHDVGSVENPQLSHIRGELGHPVKENGSCGCEFGDSGRARFGRDQKIAQNCDGYVSNTGAVDGVKGADDCCGGVARKEGFVVSGNPGSSRFDILGLHGKPEGIMGGMSDNRPNQETIEVKVSFASKKGTQLHNHNLHCEFGPDSTKASSVPNNQTPKKRKRMKRHRPKVFDESKPVKPSTPKLQTPKRAKCVKKDSLKNPVEPPKDVDREAVGDYNKNSCRQKLDFNMENCIMNQNPKACNGIESKPEVEPKLQSGSRFSSSRVYQRIFRPNECLKNSRKLGPNCPHICKKTRMSRRRATVFDKLIGLVSMIPTTKKQRRAAMNEPINLYPMVEDRKTKSPTSSQRQKSLRAYASTAKRTREAVKHPTFEKCTLNLTWMVNLKRKRSKTSTRRRDLSSFVNDLSKSQVSETFLLKASSIRTKDTGGDKLAARLEVQDDAIQHLETKKLIEQQELPKDNVVSRSGSIQKCPAEFGDRMLGVETDLPEHSLEIDMLNYQVGKSLESDVTTPYLVGPRDEEKNLLASRDYDAFTEALVDFASQKMEYLNLYDGSNQLVVRDQNGHGALIPSKEKIDPSKRRKPLPKVDLDAETMRVWNLLMENSGSEDTEQEDDDKAKYWKEQRELYRGRVESFLARMHLIQGDRRFSPWKGSVVDSVVGVFLTQNVSDHLSSSAFMSLAARFPPPSVSEHNGCDGRSDCVIHDIQQVKITGPPSGKCEELLPMEKYPSSSPSNQVGVDPENGNKTSSQTEPTIGRKRGKVKDKQENPINWDDLRKKYSQGISRNRMDHTIDSVNWEAVRQAPVDELAKVIMERGMNNILAGRIKDFLDRLVRDHGSIDLEWLRDVPPDKAKEYLLSIPGLGLKSVECVRLLALHHHAFPVDTNVGRILVRLGWVPLQPLPEDVQIHLLNQYPLLDNIQKYFWPRLCGLKQQKLYETHCQFIALGKAICTKRQPNCNACPMRGECRHFASAFASARLRLEGSRGGNMATESSAASGQESMVNTSPPMLSNFDGDFSKGGYNSRNCEPIVEMPTSPVDACTEVVVEKDIEEYFNCESEMPTIKLNSEECTEMVERDREDFKCESEMPTIKLNSEEFIKNVLCFMDGEDAMSKALITLSPEVASIPVPKLKYVSRLRTVHHVYELPDSHPLLAGQFEKRDPDDLCPYLLAIWITDETTNSSQESRKVCNCQESTKCDLGTCSGETVQCQNDQIVQGTVLIPCRTANRGSFPLNGTYFQLNEVFADHESSRQPIAVPREWIWNLRRRALYCGTSVTSICRGMSQEEIQCLFWKGFMCIRGIDRLARGPKPLARRFHVCKTRQVNDE